MDFSDLSHHSRSRRSASFTPFLLPDALLPLALGVLACVLLHGSAQAASAEQKGGPDAPFPVIRTLTLDDLIRMSREASPQLWAEYYALEQGQAQLDQARSGRLPRLEAFEIASLVPAAKGNAVFSPDERSNLLDDLGPFTRIEVHVNQPLYTFGRLKAHVEAAQKGLEAKEASMKKFELELVKSVRELYYTAQLNNEVDRVVSDTVEQFEKAVEKAEEFLETGEGTVTQQDLLKLRYGSSRAKEELLRIKKGKLLTHSAIRRLISLPKGEEFELAEKNLKPVSFTLQELEFYQGYVKERPEWRQLEAGIDAKRAELRAEQRAYLPDIFVTGLFRYAVAPDRDRQENPFVVEEFNYLDGGVLLGWRLALDFGLPHRIAEKRAEVLRLEQQKREASSGLVLEIEQAYREVEEQHQRLAFAAESRKSGRGLAATSAASFHLGLSDAKDVFEAFGIYTEAAAHYYVTIKDFNIAVAELQRVTVQEPPAGEK
ncbi:MAG: TolC family protein [bacterium]